MIEIQCECGKFLARLPKFPKNTPGRLRCYCDDCQSYMHYLKRTDLLDKNGGTEVIPVYPSDMQIIKGKEHLKCTRLKPNGMFRFSTTCCNTPIANTDPRRPWVGTHRRAFTARDPKKLDELCGEVRSSIMGKFAHGEVPPGTPESFDFKGFKIVMPFLLKGMIFGNKRPSPFFENDAPIVPAQVLTLEERRRVLDQAKA